MSLKANRSKIVAYNIAQEVNTKALDRAELASWSPTEGFLWVHLSGFSNAGRQWLNTESGLDPVIIKTLVAKETRPRTITNSKGILLILRGVNLNIGEDPEDMIAVRIWVDEHRIITSVRRELRTIRELQAAICADSSLKSPGEFLCLLIERLTSNISEAYVKLDDEVDGLVNEVLTSSSQLLRPKISDLRRQAIELRRYLAPQRDALVKLEHSTSPLLSGIDKIQIREANDSTTRYIEGLDSARERAAVAHEELMSRVSELIESRMYILSVITLIFLPLTFLTGLLGINVAGIPGANNNFAFGIVCISLLIISGFMLWYLYRKNWLG